MKQILIVFLTIQILFTMEIQAQGFKRIEAEKLTLDVFNASENSFGIEPIPAKESWKNDNGKFGF